MFLSHLKPGQKAEIKEVSTLSTIDQRIAAFGISAGKCIQVTRIAPLGDPIAISIEGTEVMLRKSEAQSIKVEPIN